MNKYIAKTVFQIISGKGEHRPQFDEQLRVIEAKDEKEALRKAREKGRNEEDSFPNNENETVKWKFIEVTDLMRIENMSDGAEIYSRIEEADDAAQYITVAKQKARTIETLSNFVYIF
ncbi:MAG TPA: DUF4288 domain-containing protein [Bacteroidia bacterium]|jgi:hypothetical protein|nr:DUF4288 domain-containing protein [Bacteroidia bacterium]